MGSPAYQRMVAEFAGTVADGRSHGLGIEHGLHLQRLVESAETHLLLTADAVGLTTPDRRRAAGPG